VGNDQRGAQQVALLPEVSGGWAGGEWIVEPCFDDPLPDYDTEPVMAYANDPDFAA
jgi:hypothetical protein